MKMKAFRDIQLSCLGMGNMRLPKTGTGPDAKIDWEKSEEIIDYAMANGINYYDTAWIYNGGESEKCLGHCISKYPRDSYYLADKFFISDDTPDPAPVLEEQLRRLKTDHIDFYLVHCLMENNVDRYLESGAIEYLMEQKRLGRIRYLGFSSHANLENLTRFANHHDWDFAQLQLNYYDWDFGTAKEELKILADRNIPVMVMEPVRGGRLADLTPSTNAQLKEAHPDWSIASWALRFVETLPNVQVILSGMSDMDQIRDNIATFCDPVSLTDEDLATLKKVSAEFRSQILVPCTGCRYCCENCPMQINIPAYLSLYNEWKVEGNRILRQIGGVKSEGKPADCIGCGACMGHCPQSIQIPDILKELADATK